MCNLMRSDGQGDDELNLKEGEKLKVIGKSPDEGWVMAENASGSKGFIPETHIKYAA